MQRERRTEQEPHTYSVFVDSISDAGDMSTRMVYFGSSKYSAQQALARAIIDNPDAHKIDFRRDLQLLVRVYVERPS